MNIMRTPLTPKQDRDSAKAIAELVAALGGLISLIESGYLVRDISKDAEPGFAMRQLGPVHKLATAHAVLAKHKGA